MHDTSTLTDLEKEAYDLGSEDGYADARMGMCMPRLSLKARWRQTEGASSYTDGYSAGWMSGSDAREACEL